MTTMETSEPTPLKPLRLWPALALVATQLLAKWVLPLFGSVAGAIGAMSALLCGLLLVVWWALFSRAPRPDRWGGAVLMIAAVFATRSLVHESIATAGMGVSFYVYIAPVLSLAFVAWALASRGLAETPRRLAMVATILVACGGWTLLRMDGITGDGASEFAWRWAETHEEKLLARASEERTGSEPIGPASAQEADWPGFRGADRDGAIHGVRIETDWRASPPVELWRRPIGPGWSSFAVHGNLVYTQEQRGENEVVSCYNASTGELVWRHSDGARFWESHAGAGPRATPALSDGHVYSFGATGILNALDAADGTLVWSRNAAADAEARVPDWGFTSSPLIVEDRVFVYAGALAAYDAATGEPRWFGPKGGSYSSPHLVTLDGIPQVLMQSGSGVSSFAPADGTLLWEHPWASGIVQPALAADGDVLVSAGGLTGGLGLRRVGVSRTGSLRGNSELRGSTGWAAEERWTSARLRPNFSDFVAHNGHAFGFDGRILACISLENGERAWKGGRYGSGQLVLLPDQDLLIVMSEKGELALVEASTEKFNELARIPAVEGKTWNHPVLVGDLLLVRNGQEMVAYRLALADG